ncbi:porin family protein [Winogradskyella alexanderae]|uniref:PorT family protein n=1 Tax=Winogradskyella alexanderae TaxID=2877123 RepID=A0ABS7XQ68_9FLAO|nr:porin family protein [Winogradskyella alexanderae]MCA0131654.1 PorT family protein [Winogradskyella alexanderae]
MKKVIFTVVLIVLSLTLNAQNDKGDFQLGANVGLSMVSVSEITGQNGTDPRFTANVALSGEYFLSEMWGIKTKLIYDNKGWADGFIFNEDTNVNTTTDFKLSYLTIPVMANIHFGSNYNWYVNFGPYVGLLLNVEDTALGMDLTDSFKSTDFGLAYGAGYQFVAGETVKLFIELEFQTGFIDVFEINEGNAITNSRVSFNFGALFNL